MDIVKDLLVWGIIGIAGATVVFAFLVILSLVFDGLLDRLFARLKKKPRK